jgi:hypothetical protein
MEFQPVLIGPSSSRGPLSSNGRPDNVLRELASSFESGSRYHAALHQALKLIRERDNLAAAFPVYAGHLAHCQLWKEGSQEPEFKYARLVCTCGFDAAECWRVD